MLPEGKRPFGSTVIAQRGQESMRKRQRGTRPVSDEPLSAGRVEYLEQARERVRNRRIRRTALIVAALTLVVLFQPEIRRALERMGQTDQWAYRFFNKNRYNDTSLKGAWRSAIIAICDAAERFSETKTGALIVFERRERLGEIISTGTMVDAAPSAELIKNIFFKNSPLHDGAMIVRAGRVCAAGCVLPLSGNQSLSRDLGTRHRAAVGMSESADSVLVVVSEETGSISVAIGGMLKRHLSPDMLRKLLENELLDSEKQEKSRLAAIRDMWKGGAGK